MPAPPPPAVKPIAVVPQPAEPKKQQPAPAPMVLQRPVQQPVAQPPRYIQPQADFGETTVLGGGAAAGETTVLRTAQSAEATPYLIRCKNNEKIALNKPVFRVGKEKSYVDYFIGDNTAISRSHANIITREGEYFIVDTNSTNHTYVNGAIIQSNIEFKLESGARIRLANENFEFKTY
jgi:pSer/pThr/pTyr-binding forkhead associated (FHA) protein